MFKKSKVVSKLLDEELPEIGTVQNPVLYYGGDDVYLSYQVSPRGGSGSAILKFSDVIEVTKTSVNVRGLGDYDFPCEPWRFNKITGTENIVRWKGLKPRYWVISFNDETVEILFSSVSIIKRIPDNGNPVQALKSFIRQS